MNNKTTLIFIIIFILLAAVGFCIFIDTSDNSYESYTKNKSIVLDNDNSTYSADDSALVIEYFKAKGISGNLYSYDVAGESTPEEVSEYDVEYYYELASNGMTYYAVVLNGVVKEIEVE